MKKNVLTCWLLVSMAVLLASVRGGAQAGVPVALAKAFPALPVVTENASPPPPEAADDPEEMDDPEEADELESAEESGATAAPPSTGFEPPSDSRVAVIRIEGMIYDFVLESMKRRVDRALSEGANLIVFEYHTDGGLVTSALDISQYIKGLEVPTVAWVNKKAYSAGIIIAAASRAIVMAPASVTGDAAPIQMGGEGLKPTERAKALSPILLQVRDSAERNGYDFVLFHAMCELGVEVYLIEHKESGRRMLVNQADYKMMVDGKTLKEVETALRPKSGQGDPLSLPRVKIEVATEEDRDKWKPIEHVHGGSTLLTVNETQAKKIGLSMATVRDDDELRHWLGAASIGRVDQSWSEDLAAWLVHPAVRAVLIMGLMLGAYMELQTPGVGLPGGVALGCLVILLGSPFLVDLSETWHVIVFLLGFILLMVEVFVTPGFGVLGILGVVLMFGGLVLGVVPTEGDHFLPSPAAWGLLESYVLWTLAGVGGSIACLVLLIYFSGKVPILDRMVLQTTQQAGISTIARPTVSGSEALGSGRVHVGATGRVVSELRPTGRADIGGQLVDVVSFGEWIETGGQVRVVEVHGNRIVVESVA